MWTPRCDGDRQDGWNVLIQEAHLSPMHPLVQQGLDETAQAGAGDLPHDPVADDAVAVQDEGCGHAIDAAEGARDAGIGQRRREVIVRRAHEAGDRRCLILDADCQDLEAARRVFPVEGLHRRHLVAAEWTPGGPEVDQHHLAAQA